MKELGAPIRQWVPDWLGLICIFIVILPVTMLNGSYTGSMLEVSNTLGTNTEDITLSLIHICASGYIKEVRFKEHQYVHQGDTLLILDRCV